MKLSRVLQLIAAIVLLSQGSALERASAIPVDALVIDRFFGRTVWIEGPGLAEQSDRSDVIGNVRLLTVAAGSDALISNSGFIRPSVAPGAPVSLIYDGVPFDPLLGGVANSGSAGALGLDLSAYGRIVLDGLVFDSSVALVLYDGTDSEELILNVPGFEQSPFFDLSGFGSVDLSDIRSIEFRLLEWHSTPTRGSVRDIFAAPIPEPTMAWLLAAGIATFGLRRRRRA